MRKSLTTMALAGAALLIATGPALADHEGTAYEGSLNELNASGGSGDAYLEVSEDGESLEVTVNATGLNLDGPHAMHIHGVLDGDEIQASACPTMDDDANGDGVLDVAEGVPLYGGIQVSLTTEGDTSPDSALAVDRYPVGTDIEYMRGEIDLPDNVKPSLDKVHVVVHGIDENGNGTLDMDQEERSSLTEDLPREATAPALCGELTAVAAGAVQTGGGGTADTGNGVDGAALAGLGLAGLAGLAVTTRRRRAGSKA